MTGTTPSARSQQHVETSPNGRYIRYSSVLGKGAYKTVYKAFDTEEALEVAWNKLHVDRLSEQDLEKVSTEVSLLRQVEHKNIIHFYDTWRGVDGNGNQTINFITEQMMSGTLKEYLRKAKAIKLKVIRRWCSNLLDAIAYLHSQKPPIMHRDLKCDNIFINGHVGEVKIGDLGLSGVKEREKADSVIGTPEFMAPELYEESYTEKVDIYAFGMCLLEIVSMEYPYSECNNMAQIFKKVFGGEKPHAFEMLVDGDVKDVIAACLQREARRPSAVDLLRHPLFSEWDKDDGSVSNLSLVKGMPDSAAVNLESAPSSNAMPIGTELIDWSDPLNRNVLVSMKEGEGGGGADNQVSVIASRENGGFYIGLEIPIRDAIKRVEFTFDPFEDSSQHIAQEMVAEFGLGDEQLNVIREEIDRRVRVAKNQREAASRNATPQPAPREAESSGKAPLDTGTSVGPNQVLSPPLSSSLQASSHLAPLPVDQAEETQLSQIVQGVQAAQADDSGGSGAPPRVLTAQNGSLHRQSQPESGSGSFSLPQVHPEMKPVEVQSQELPESPLDLPSAQESLPQTSSFRTSQARSTTPVDSPSGVLSPGTGQEIHMAPAALSQSRHTGMPESGIRVALQDANIRKSELVQSRVPGETQFRDSSSESVTDPEIVGRGQVASEPEDVAAQESNPASSSSAAYASPQEVVPSHENMHSAPIVAPTVADTVAERRSEREEHDPLALRHFPQSVSDGQLPPASSVTVVDIPPRPPSTPVMPASGMDLSDDHHFTSPPIAAAAYQGPEDEPVEVMKQAVKPSDPSIFAVQHGSREASAGNGHAHINTIHRSASGTIPPIVVVGTNSQGTATEISRRHIHEFSVQSLPSFPTTENFANIPYTNPQSSGLSQGSSGRAVAPHGVAGNISYHQSQSGDLGRKNSGSSPQRSPSAKAAAIRTNSWKSLQSDDSGNNLAPRVPAGKVIGDEHDQKYYTMCLTLMDRCARGRREDVVKKLRDGANPNFADYDMRTPLHLAAAEGHMHICSLLIENGALVSRKDRWANTPLADAIENGHVDVQNLLKSHGAVDERRSCTDNVDMELMRVAANGDLESVRAKIVAGADVTYADYDQRTPLHLACSEGHPEVAELLLVNGASPEVIDRKGRSPVDDAVKNGHRNILRVLRQYGANIPRHLFEAQPELENQKGIDLIEHAARGRVGAVKKALEQGANPNFADYDRRTALHLACVEGRMEVARVLLEAGASLNVRDRWGSTPADEAKKGGFSNIADELFVWESKRKQRQAAAMVSFDHTALIMNGHDRSSMPPRETESAHFDQLTHGIASSVSLGAIPTINLSADDFAAKYPSSSAVTATSGDNSSSTSLPPTPFDRSEDFSASGNLENEQRLLQQAYDAEKQKLDEQHRKALEGLQRKKSAESRRSSRSSAEGAPVVSIVPIPAVETSEDVGFSSEVGRRRSNSGGDAATSGSFSSLSNGAEIPRGEVKHRMIGEVPRTAVGSASTSPIQVVRPPRYQPRDVPQVERVTGYVNPEIRSLVDNLIDLASTQR